MCLKPHCQGRSQGYTPYTKYRGPRLWGPPGAPKGVFLGPPKREGKEEKKKKKKEEKGEKKTKEKKAVHTLLDESYCDRQVFPGKAFYGKGRNFVSASGTLLFSHLMIFPFF